MKNFIEKVYNKLVAHGAIKQWLMLLVFILCANAAQASIIDLTPYVNYYDGVSHTFSYGGKSYKVTWTNLRDNTGSIRLSYMSHMYENRYNGLLLRIGTYTSFPIYNRNLNGQLITLDNLPSTIGSTVPGTITSQILLIDRVSS